MVAYQYSRVRRAISTAINVEATLGLPSVHISDMLRVELDPTMERLT